MSERIAYLERTDRGDRLARIRLFGGRSELEWVPEAGATAAEAARAAARWIRQSLADDARRALAMVCLDGEGGLWSWVAPPSRDPRVVETLVRQAGGNALVMGLEHQSYEEERPGSSIAPDVETPGATSVQVLAPPVKRRIGGAKGAGPTNSDRVSVLAMRDATARLVLDELDRAGVLIESVSSIWHALAAACDPAGPGTGASSGGRDVVGQSDQTIGAVMVDPAGKILWAWSYRGEVLAGGSLAVAGHAGAARVSEADLGRLATEWMSWGAQTGHVPARVVCVCGPTGDDGLEPAQIGAGLARACDAAPVDMAAIEDPVAWIFGRLGGLSPRALAPARDPKRAMVGLSHRPGRAHRAMYLWSALGVALGGAVCLLAAGQLLASARESREAAAELRGASAEVFRARVPNEPAQGSVAVMKMQQLVASKRQSARRDPLLAPAKPILTELDTIMFLVRSYGPMGLELNDLVLEDTNARLTVHTVDLEMYEDFRQGLETIDGSRLSWGVPRTTPAPRDDAPDRIKCDFTGTWGR